MRSITDMDLDMSSFYSNPQKFFDMMAQAHPNLPVPPSFPSAAEIRNKSTAYSKEIFNSWTTLRDILARREEVIRKRWMNKRKEQRKKILLAAWPDMPEQHRPDFYELEKTGSRGRSRNIEAFKYPYVNQEDLLQGRALLLFLNSRGRNPPHSFAHADLDATHVGQTSKMIVPVFLNQYTMYIAGESDPDSYGRLVSWDDDDDAFMLHQNCLQFQPGTGLLVLEIQSKIYSFLLECCYQLFHDVPRDELASLQLPEQPEPPPIVASETSYAQLSSVAAEAPYRLPAKLDTRRLVLLVEAKRAAAEDLVWDLREDPGYFASVAIDQAQHRQESLLDVWGQRHPHDDDEVFWNRVIRSVPVEAYMSFLSWDVLYNYAVSLDDAFKSAGTLNHDQPLPEKLETALVELCFAAEMISKGLIGELKSSVPASSPMRERFVREPQQPGTAVIQIKTKQGVGKDPLLQLFSMLWDADKVFLTQLPNLVDELQRCVDHDPGQKGRTSSCVAGYFSDLALIAQLVRQVKTFFPWAAGLEIEMGPENRGPGYAKATEDAATVYQFFREDLAPNLARIVVPLSRHLQYPTERVHNVTNVNACRQAENQLDRLWKVVDAHFRKYTDKTLHEIFLSRDVKAREIHRTPEWTPPPQVPQPPNKEKENEALSDSFSRLNVEPDRPGKFKGPEVSRASKFKTRGPSHPPDSSDATPPVPDDPTSFSTPPFPVFTLPRRAYRVFASLFPTPSNSSQGGEISWIDFLHAMTRIGFAAEKLYGSVWQFTPPDGLDWENTNTRGIHIHEPHPAPKMGLGTARRIGRRLGRRYGLSAERFALA
ncbi:hypothetical protein, variant 2 [Cladophialophora immunda]|uniref:Uncharacterized protein n=1 Tax=Cladophialophora immunda TaxID=569365 RepID=A0A0D1ZMM4_9EURO|nr:uncharacterized protein PV07_05047 [Cladophialophora immunda]XP_016249437.1 hypothetical protein, variant 1 [Cladophialophora immunda]XP_016249438.1 hypothetical protein, variant 2 [Cladophialophora immunda]KIW29220.1 hypothetical protein PV07_05047 [Cladophialophora immunda]KIW29221.1 hypothetical protein, variant 1 [Cladophialophora immunda]KIW29222.1 hypothetical protein, variant 2 [Cladophialophora immunda]